jgi:DNA recombination protein RmuC
MIVGLVVGLVIGAALGLAIGFAVHLSKKTVLVGEIAQLKTAAVELSARREEDRQRMSGEFSELSSQALRQNAEQFLLLAEGRLKEAQEAARGDLGQRQQAIAHLLDPLTETLARYDQSLRQLELDRKGAYAGLTEQVKQVGEANQQLQKETHNLVSALRAPQTRGRWGEVQLRRVVEMAGMVSHCDFDEQVNVTSEDGRLRPDLVVHLPGGSSVVVDAKVPLDAYLRAAEAANEDDRRTELIAHARHVRSHVDALAKKQYWNQFEHSPEWVVAFVPGDQWLAAAFEYDPRLLEYAMSQRVLLASPITLIALLHTFASNWKQNQLADNAREVQRLGAELYDRLRVMGGHLTKLQRSLTGAVGAYNDAIGSLETRVLVTARRFPELGIAIGVDEIEESKPIVAAARSPQAQELIVLSDEEPVLAQGILGQGLRALRPAPSDLEEPGVGLG